MDLLRIYLDHGVPTADEGQRHYREGWLNTPCPFCTGNFGFHLGATIDGRVFYCWRCGWKPPTLALSKLLNVKESEVPAIIKEYGGPVLDVIQPEIHTKPWKIPAVIGLQPNHKRYLKKRGFDYKHLEDVWGITGTGPTSTLDGISYAYRLFIPIYWNGQMVTFQTRDVTNKHPQRYLACPKDREQIHHKHILYGQQQHWGATGICVEGVTDVWRLGVNSFATFGIKYTPKQLRVMAQNFKRIAVVFDDDPQAVEQAGILVDELKFRNVDAWRVPIVGDPASLSDDDAKHLVNSII